jgi:hypothetical protein
MALEASSSTSSKDAIPLGTTVKTIIERGDAYLAPQLYYLEITVMEVVRGSEVFTRPQNPAIAAQPPPENFVHLLVRLKLHYLRKVRGLVDETFQITEGQFIAVSADGKIEYPIPSIALQPQPQLIGRILIPDDSLEGWILLQAPRDGPAPFLVFKRKHVEGIYGIWACIWFKLL